MITHHRPKPPKLIYRRSVWCKPCQALQEFKRDAGRWLCKARGHEHSGPDPWVRR